ncbi:MAG TPA: alpha-(1-_3)-arabinofuranosyltransferase family protein, partial [Acidimicrobiales bacterium]|nr:alpha-(1->3)-arabinofuranosyltransferase family protein [Acidimicrobiales bacterium]
MTLGPGEPITVPSHWRATHDAGAGWSRASAKKERKNERKKDAQSSRYPGIDRTVLVGLSLVVAIVVFANSWGKFVSDTQPELYFTPGRVFWESLHAWVPSVGQVGIPNLNTGLAPEAALIWLIRVVGTPAWVTVRIWRLALYLVAGLGIRRWYRELEGGKADTAALLAVTVFYVANPYVITVGATTPIMLPYAVLPWLLRAHLRSVHDPTSWRRAVVFGLTFAAMSGQNAGIVPLFLLLALPCQILWVRWTDGVPWRSLWASLWRCGAVTTGLSLYWLLPSLAALRTGQ